MSIHRRRRSRLLAASALLAVTLFVPTAAGQSPGDDKGAEPSSRADASPRPSTAHDGGEARVVESSPVPPTRKNPVDILPPDTIYPPQVSVQPKPVVWRREWPRFGLWDWIITGSGAAAALTTAIVAPQGKNISGGLLFDEDVRDAIRLRDPQARYTARDVSDVILSLEATWPFFVDSLIITWWFRGSPDAAAQMALVDAEALAVVTGIQGITNTIASRERPYGRTCGSAEQPEATVGCEGSVRYRSFFSGHAAFAFMGAGLVCSHHLKHGLFRGGGDTAACIVAYTGAAATATLRVMGDMHYATDVMTGSAVGIAVGLIVPWLHYREVNIANETRTALNVRLVPVGAGLGIGGTF